MPKQNQHFAFNKSFKHVQVYSLPWNSVYNGNGTILCRMYATLSKLSNHFLLFSFKYTDRTFVEMTIMEHTLSCNMLVNRGSVLYIELGGTSRDCDVHWKFNQMVSNALVNNYNDRCDPLMKTD